METIRKERGVYVEGDKVSRKREKVLSLQRRSWSRSPQCYLIDGIKLSKMRPAYFAWPRQQWSVQFLGNTPIYLSLLSRPCIRCIIYTETTPLLSRSHPLSLSWFRWSSFSRRGARTTLFHDGIPPNINLVAQDLSTLQGAINLSESLTEKTAIRIIIKISLRFQDHDLKYLVIVRKGI